MSFYSNKIRKYVFAFGFAPLVRNISPSFFLKQEAEYLKQKDYVEIHLLKALCNSSKSCFDIGVLWGGYSYFLKTLAEQVHCFEPNKTNFAFLKKVFGNQNNIHLNNVAISSQEGEVILTIPKNEPGNATIEPENPITNASNLIQQPIATRTLTSSDYKNIGFIKIDVEGHEFDVLKGAEDIIKNQKPNLLVEIEERHKKGNIDKINSWGNALGFDMYFVENKTLKALSLFDVNIHQNIDKKNSNGLYINNFILVHQSNLEVLKKVNSVLERL